MNKTNKNKKKNKQLAKKIFLAVLVALMLAGVVATAVHSYKGIGMDKKWVELLNNISLYTGIAAIVVLVLWFVVDFVFALELRKTIKGEFEAEITRQKNRRKLWWKINKVIISLLMAFTILSIPLALVFVWTLFSLSILLFFDGVFSLTE